MPQPKANHRNLIIKISTIVENETSFIVNLEKKAQAMVTHISFVLQDRPVYSREDWQSFVYEDCITFQNKLVVSKLKPWFYLKYAQVVNEIAIVI